MLDGKWIVYSGYMECGVWVKDNILICSNSIADCYAWIKAKEEGLLDN